MFAARKKLKRQDFLFQNGWFQQKIKKPGQLQMQQFQISDCEQCSIYLLDSSACVYIDCCKFCTIFIGSSQSSIFVRDSHHLTIVCITQQFRVRDCYDCKMILFCESQPVVQSSYAIEFYSFPSWGYQQLERQVKQAKIKQWNNNWFDIYDFTPNKFRLASNYTLGILPANVEKQLRESFKEVLSKEGMNFDQKYCPVAKCIGKHAHPLQNTVILVIFPVIKPSVCINLQLIQSRVHNVSAQQRKQLKINLSTQNQSKIEILFIKIKKQDTGIWKKTVKEIKMTIQDAPTIEQYQNRVFASFKDQH